MIPLLGVRDRTYVLKAFSDGLRKPSVKEAQSQYAAGSIRVIAVYIRGRVIHD